MDKYIFNVFAPCLILIRYVAFTTSPIDKSKFSHSLQEKIQAKNAKSLMEIDARLNSCARLEQAHDWTLLVKPHLLLKTIMDYHMIRLPLFLSMVTQTCLIFYILIKCFFHILQTGADNELANHYDRVYFFPRLFESHERPELFYGHTLVIIMYMFSVRWIAFYRLVKMSILNKGRYEQVSISQLNYGYLAHLHLTSRQWLRLMVDGIRHFFDFRRRDHAQKLRDHLHFDRRVIEEVGEQRYRDLIYYINQINFDRCYQSVCPSLLTTESGKSAGEQAGKKSRYIRWHSTWPLHRADITELALLAIAYVIITVSIFVGIWVVSFCSLYFELEGAAREKHGVFLSFLDTLRYLPEWLEEPRRVIRLLDLSILALIQLPAQFDAAVYITDVVILISRAYKVLLSLEHDRTVSNAYMGQSSLDGCPDSIQLDAAKEFQLSLKEQENLNRRLMERIRVTQVLKTEFMDLKRTHTLFLNTMIFFSGLSISYCVSLIILSTSFSTTIAIGLNAFIQIAPMITCMVLSAMLNIMFKGINRNLHLLVINERSYLTKQTVKCLMIECGTFDTARERSIQIAGTFSITPESLGPLIAYMSTCILFLTNKFKSN